jgi:hypothetical protein
MKEKKRKRSRQFSFVVSEVEYNTIKKLFARSTCRSINDYARSLALQKPIVVKIRNESAENFLLEMIPLKNQLEETATHFRRAIISIQSLGNIPAVKAWCLEPRNSPELLLTQIEALRQLMNQYYIQCTR